MRFGGFPAWAEDLAEGIRSHFDAEQARSCCCDHLQAVRSFMCPVPLIAPRHHALVQTLSTNRCQRHASMSHMTRHVTMQLAERQPLFDQLIANKYRPGEGLKPHVDLMRFQDGVAIVSLQAAATLSFTKGDRRVDVLLLPGDLLLLEGEARCE